MTSQPVSVAILSGPLGLGGAEQQLFYFASGIPRARIRLHLIAIGGSPDDPWCDRLKALDIKVTHLQRLRGRWATFSQIAGILRSDRAQIVHGWLLYLNLYAAIAGVMAGVAGRIGSIREDANAFPRERVLRRLSHASLDALIANSERGASNIPPFTLRRAATAVIPNGVVVPPLASEQQQRQLKRRLGQPETRRLIGAVGRLDANKNFEMLIRAFARIAGTHQDTGLVIVGEGPRRRELLALANHLGLSERVLLPGRLADAPLVVNAFDVACLTSWREGLPNVLMEASAAGIPVVSTTAGGAVELVDAGKTGFLVAPNDDAAAAACLDRLLGDSELARAMGCAGRTKMQTQFSVDRMVSGTLDVYERVLARTMKSTRASL